MPDIANSVAQPMGPNDAKLWAKAREAAELWRCATEAECEAEETHGVGMVPAEVWQQISAMDRRHHDLVAEIWDTPADSAHGIAAKYYVAAGGSVSPSKGDIELIASDHELDSFFASITRDISLMASTAEPA